MSTTTLSVYTNSRNRTYKLRGGRSFKWSGEERPNGDPLLDDRARWVRDGYATAIDKHGYTYVCGYDATASREDDGTGIYAETRDGKRHVWHRSPDSSWTEDTTAAAVAHANLQTPENLRSTAAWALPHGQKFDRSAGRGVVFDVCKSWAGAYKRGEASSLWLTGQPGRGKSQLASWILSDLAALSVTADRLLMPTLIRIMRNGYGDSETAQSDRTKFVRALGRAQTVAVLVLEDVSADRQAEDVRKLLYDLLDARISRNLPTIFTDNSTPEALDAIGWDSRVASRCKQALVLSLAGQDYRAAQPLRF